MKHNPPQDRRGSSSSLREVCRSSDQGLQAFRNELVSSTASFTGAEHCMWIEEPLGTLLWHVLGAWNFPSNAGARPRQLGAPPANFPASPEASRDALYNPVLCELPRAFWPVVISSEAVVRDPCDRLVSEFAWARLQGWYNRLGAFGLSFCMILRCGRFGFWLFR